ncbi:unnamed protein product [Timema podura]|uniref:Uncharacterized protein n=1 Tax=Timema podura TaxID=61482 RepID=A0ABN7P0W8_TIMPD|nr:unnamed protein product [Timema podura]
MVFGAVKGKPSYLMPFFCLQVFDFCIASVDGLNLVQEGQKNSCNAEDLILTAVGYLCYLPDIHRLVAQNNHLPFRGELTETQSSVLVFASPHVAYFIGVVWSCYKYLSLRLVAAQRIIHYIDPDSQSLLPDLPDYETAMGDPRFMKKFPTPPPSYSAAVEIPVAAPVTVSPPSPTSDPVSAPQQAQQTSQNQQPEDWFDMISINPELGMHSAG